MVIIVLNKTRLSQLHWSFIMMLSLEAPCCVIEAGLVHHLSLGSRLRVPKTRFLVFCPPREKWSPCSEWRWPGAVCWVSLSQLLYLSKRAIRVLPPCCEDQTRPLTGEKLCSASQRVLLCLHLCCGFHGVSWNLWSKGLLFVTDLQYW